jgi:hypothetical protein
MDASQGVQLATMKELGRYWATGYDWRRCEAKLNKLSVIPNKHRRNRAAAIYHLQLMYVVDEFLTAAIDARVAVVAVAVVFGWPSARGLSVGNIADQLGCSLSTLTRSKRWPGLGSPPASFGPVPDH